MKEIIRKLVEATGPSGYEGAVRALVKAEIAPLADDLQVDALGNLIARKGRCSQGGRRILLSAHLDEIGVMVTHVDERGFARFLGLGPVLLQTLIGGRVQFLNGARGIIAGEPLENQEKLHKFDQLFIDTGATHKQDSPVRIGDVAVFERPYLELGHRLIAKALDDRAGVAVLIDVMRNLQTTPHEIFFVFSTQEEVGERGAGAAAFGVNPELAISVDATPASDTPKENYPGVSLGKGPAIKVRDAGMIADPRVVRWMTETAEDAKIPYQLEILEGRSTGARVMQINRDGVPAGSITIPCRYNHTPSEMMDFGDVQNTAVLLVELLKKPVPWS